MNDTINILSALKAAEAWLDRWAVHVGTCKGGSSCTCGLTSVRFEAREAINAAEYGE